MDGKIPFVWEKFINEPKGKSERDAWFQVLAFNIDIGFEESLMEQGFTLEEATAIYIMDTELRMSHELSNPEIKEVTIDI